MKTHMLLKIIHLIIKKKKVNTTLLWIVNRNLKQ